MPNKPLSIEEAIGKIQGTTPQATSSPQKGKPISLEEGVQMIQNAPLPQRQERGTIAEGAANIVRDITKPVVTLAARPYQVGAELGTLAREAITGQKISPQEAQARQTVNLPFYGEITPSTGVSDVVSDVGRGVQTVGLGIGGGAAVKGFGGALGQAVRQGAVAGGVAGAGMELEEKGTDVRPGGLLGSTLGGAAVGGAIAPIAPIAGSAFRSAPGRLARGQVVGAADEAVRSLERSYDEVFELTKPLQKQANFSRQQGLNPSKVLSERKLIFDIEDGKIRTEKVVSSLDDEITTKSRVLDNAIAKYPQTVTREQVKNTVMRKIANDPLIQQEGRVAQLQKQASDEIDNLFNQKNADRLRLIDIQEFKKGQWRLSKKFKPSDVGRSDVHSAVGSGLREVIEENIPDVAVRQLNKQIGELQDTLNLVRRADGTAVKGGRLGGGIAQIAGAVAGSQHGIIGSILGAIGGRLLARQLQKAAIIGPINRALLKYSRIAPDDEILQKAINFIEDVESGKTFLPDDETFEFLRQMSQKADVPLLPAAQKDAIRSQVGSGPVINLPEKTQSTLDKLDIQKTAPQRVRQEIDSVRTTNTPLLRGPGENPIIPTNQQ